MKRSASTALTTKGGAPKSRFSKKRRVTKRRFTTLRRQPDGPFPASKRITMVYENALTPISGAAAFLSKSVKYNSLYDFDNGTGDLGNKQPLYFDTLFTASGPYKQYKVHSWKATWTFVNTSATPQSIWVIPPLQLQRRLTQQQRQIIFPELRDFT